MTSHKRSEVTRGIDLSSVLMTDVNTSSAELCKKTWWRDSLCKEAYMAAHQIFSFSVFYFLEYQVQMTFLIIHNFPTVKLLYNELKSKVCEIFIKHVTVSFHFT